MTVHIGSFGQARPKVDAEFDWFGTTIRVHPDASDLAYTEFLALAADIEVDDEGNPTNPADNQRAAGVLDQVLRGQIHPDDYITFMKVARANRQQTLDLMALSQQIVSACSGFPTGQPSDSPTGQSGGAPTSQRSLSSRAVRRKDERKRRKIEERKQQGQRTVARAATVLSGRPDLQLMVLRRQETFADSA